MRRSGRTSGRDDALGPVRYLALYFGLALLLLSSAPCRAQTAPTVGAVSLDTSSLAAGPYARMHTLFEKTIFKVDVLRLQVRFGGEAARRIEALASGGEYSRQLADSIAQVAMHARDAFARIEFERDVSLDQFVDGIRDNLKRARDAGIISSDDYRTVSEGLPRWFSFLEQRGIHEGDRILYRIRDDSLRTIFMAANGEILLDQTDVGPERRLAVLGSYYVRKSDFREGLLESLFSS